jgi:anion-transporting  ArsA/GET3 family ATPase
MVKKRSNLLLLQELTFAQRIDDLELRNTHLMNKVKLTEQWAEVEAQQKAELEMEVMNLKSDLYQAQLTISSLEDEAMWLSTILEQYQQLSWDPCVLDQLISLLLSMRETMAPSNGQDCQ